MAIEKTTVFYIYLKMTSAQWQPLYAGVNLLIDLLFHFLSKWQVFVTASIAFGPFDAGGIA